MTINNRIRWILAMGVVFVLIISTNLIDRKIFKQMRDSSVAIYEDRLVADNLVYKLLQKTHEKELAIVGNDENYFSTQNTSTNARIEKLIERFSKTELTGSESEVFGSLKTNTNNLIAIEQSFIDSSSTDKTEILAALSTIRKDLSLLSEIQLKEGEKQMAKSQKALKAVELFTDIEIYILILISVIVFFIILYKPKDEDINPIPYK
jgi:hypothetical protein